MTQVRYNARRFIVGGRRGDYVFVRYDEFSLLGVPVVSALWRWDPLPVFERAALALSEAQL